MIIIMTLLYNDYKYQNIFSSSGLIDLTQFNLAQKTVYPLSDNFFKTEIYEYDNGIGMEYILQGLVTQNSQKFDRIVSKEVTNRLFPEKGVGGQLRDFGGDLVAR